jgi:hypothetical protein
MPRRPTTKKRPLSPAPPSRRSATKTELAREHHVSIRTVDQWIAERKIPYKKLSPRMVRFDLDAVQRALDRYTVEEVTLTTSRKSKEVKGRSAN